MSALGGEADSGESGYRVPYGRFCMPPALTATFRSPHGKAGATGTATMCRSTIGGVSLAQCRGGAEDFWFDEPAQRGELALVDAAITCGAGREMNVMTAKPQGFRSQRARSRVFLEWVRNAAPAQVIFCLFPQRGWKLEPRNPLPGNALLWDLNTAQILSRQ